MAKKIEVIVPFFVMEKGDIMTLNEDNTAYEIKYASEKHADNKIDSWSAYSAEYKISVDAVNNLIKDGFVKPIDEKESTAFVNVFDEIDALLSIYNTELAELPNTMKNQPACMKVEKETVLSNLIKVLNHLKALKK